MNTIKNSPGWSNRHHLPGYHRPGEAEISARAGTLVDHTFPPALEQFSLSPRERAGVRGNTITAYPAITHFSSRPLVSRFVLWRSSPSSPSIWVFKNDSHSPPS